MSSQIYNWRRFWCPRTGTVNLSDGGFLYDPDSEWGHIHNPHVIPFETLLMVPCLGLLGEPGIGKTHAMKAEREATHAKIQEEGGDTLWLDLRSYGSEERLARSLFENTTFDYWAKGKHRLYLFLDSLDECLLRIDNLAALLADELKRYPAERLYLRIACRTAEWPNSLENGLRQLYGNDAVGVYELAPLRRIDVVESARANNLAPDAFLGEIDTMGVVPLAIKPVTLEFLLNSFRRTGGFPSSQARLYLDGCRLLCEEPSESRRDARLKGFLSAEQRMAVAARVAAIMVFTNRYAIWTGVDRGDVPAKDVVIKELCGKMESVDGDEFHVSEEALREAVATGLFSSRGLNRMGWAHQTYAEFLAAHYLVRRKMALPQIMSLIVHPGDPDRKLVPQLHEAAAWLAGMVPEVFRKIMRIDPEVLLRSDVSTADVPDRAALLDTLLRLYEEEKVLDRGLDIVGRYKKLAQPGLAEKLRPYISDVMKGVMVRRAATDIAEACQLREVQADLAQVALDASQPHPIRVNAAYAIGRMGDDATKAKLKPLATGEAGEDPDDELKGSGLQAVWPAHMTAEELFAILTPPKQEGLIGSYKLFLSSQLVPALKVANLPAALEWVEKQGPGRELSHPFQGLVGSIMLQAWNHLESPGVPERFARAALSRLRRLGEIFRAGPDPTSRTLLRNEDEKRRRVLEAMVPMLSDPEEDSMRLVVSSTAMVLARDVPWMIERLRASPSRRQEEVWARLISLAFDWREPGQVDAVLVACHTSPFLAGAFRWLLQSVELDSPEASRMREVYLERQKWQQGEHDRPLLEPPPAERIARLLDKCESGNVGAWWQLNMEMTLEPDSTHYGNELESDLTALPAWNAAETGTRARILDAARRYMLEGDPETVKWLGTNTFYRSALAGYRALRLLLQESPDLLPNVPADVWKRWAPIILAYPTASGIANEEPHRGLVKMAYLNAADEIIHTLMILIDTENREGGHIFITRKVVDCWDDRLAEALLIKSKDEQLKPECMACLLGDLLDHKVEEASSLAESLILLPSTSSGERRSRAIAAARELMVHAQDAGWSVVWPAIQRDLEFGRELVSAVARHGNEWHTAAVGHRLKENELADLYIWLARQYPYAEDPRHDGAHYVGSREMIAGWRGGVLRHLKDRGTLQACNAIRRIAGELPDLGWLKWTLLEAQAIARRSTWIPPQPADIIRIAANDGARLVQGGEQLLDILLESLKRMEATLQGETPAAQFLWDKTAKSTYRPKSEASFADYVKMHLDQDLRHRGVIVNREVEIRRGEGSTPGERTDIHVDAVVRGKHDEVYDSVTAIIEVKGCWNPELNYAIKTQLMDRYLKDKRCQHGLYLIGWFNCDQWDDDDNRKGHAPKAEIDQTREQFEVQAAELSQQGTRIKAVVMNTALR